MADAERSGAGAEMTGDSLVSVVTFTYNERENLPVLYERLCRVFESVEPAGIGPRAWEFIVVDDHSTDGTFEIIRRLAAEDPRVRGIRLSRNFGSHVAKTCGLHHARGRCAIALASDLQDPPEVLPDMLAAWKDGAQVVAAVRRRRLGEGPFVVWTSRLYRWTLRKILGLKEMPATGAGLFLLDRQALDALSQFREADITVIPLIHWMGFRRTEVPYDQPARLFGRSRWTLGMKLKLFVDSATGFSDRPIQWIIAMGLLVTLAGLTYAAWIAIAGTTAGWSVVFAAVLLVGGLHLTALGVLGAYVWRALVQSRRRPQYLIEESLGFDREA
jgi:dolichol-phosphate mannosyltransferase